MPCDTPEREERSCTTPHNKKYASSSVLYLVLAVCVGAVLQLSWKSQPGSFFRAILFALI